MIDGSQPKMTDATQVTAAAAAAVSAAANVCPLLLLLFGAISQLSTVISGAAEAKC